MNIKEARLSVSTGKTVFHESLPSPVYWAEGGVYFQSVFYDDCQFWNFPLVYSLVEGWTICRNPLMNLANSYASLQEQFQSRLRQHRDVFIKVINRELSRNGATLSYPVFSGKTLFIKDVKLSGSNQTFTFTVSTDICTNGSFPLKTSEVLVNFPDGKQTTLKQFLDNFLGFRSFVL